MSQQYITYEQEGDLAIIGLNRPEKSNAFNMEYMAQLAEAALKANHEAKVGVIFGHGKHFCAGLDLASLRERMATESRQRKRTHGPGGGRGLDLISRGDIPFVSALHGAVVGGGLEIASSTHIRVADETAFFALPEGQRGIYVGAGASVRVSRLVSVARMTDMMLTGRVYSAEEAERYNIVHYITPPGQALEKAKELALKIAGNAPQTNYSVINGLPRLRDLHYDDGLFFEGLVANSTFGPDAHERLTAFVEKRAKPLDRPDQNKSDD